MLNHENWTKFKQARYFHKLARGELIKANERELQNSIERIYYFSEKEFIPKKDTKGHLLVDISKEKLESKASRNLNKRDSVKSSTIGKKSKDISLKQVIQKINLCTINKTNARDNTTQRKKTEKSMKQRVSKVAREKTGFNKTFTNAKTSTFNSQSNRIQDKKETSNQKLKKGSVSVERKKPIINKKSTINKQIKPSPSKSSNEGAKERMRKSVTPIKVMPTKTVQPRQQPKYKGEYQRKSTHSVNKELDYSNKIDDLLNRLENFTYEI